MNIFDKMNESTKKMEAYSARMKAKSETNPLSPKDKRLLANFGIILAIIFITPLGLFLMLKYRKDWRKRHKIWFIFVIFWLLFWIYLFIYGIMNPPEPQSAVNPKTDQSKTTTKPSAKPATPKIETKTITENSEVKFATKNVDDDALAKGKTKTTQKGVNGEKTTTYEIKTQDGKQISKTKTKEETTKQPVDEIIAHGTYVAPAQKPTPTEKTKTQNTTTDTISTPTPTPAPQQTFANCAELRETYPHGVGKSGARDAGGSVANFTVNDALYNSLNGNFDRDHDGIACEKQ